MEQQQILIIADIAGQYDAFMRLIARVPETTKILAVGDLMDRGPKSKEVIEWFVQNQHRADSLLGNHEHLMLDFYHDTGVYDNGVWISNGGHATRKSYRNPDDLSIERPPESHLDYLSSRELYKFYPKANGRPGLLVSHAAKHPNLTLEQAANARDWSDPNFMHGFLWNRGEPAFMEGVFQVMGHNSHWGLKSFDGWACCIDQSSDKILTGLLWPVGEILEEPYIVTEAEK